MKVAVRDQLLEAAAECLSDLGFERTRLLDVARRAGVSIGLLQHYFETRDALLREAFSWTCQAYVDVWRERANVSISDPWERIVFLVESLTSDPDLWRHSATWAQLCASAAHYPDLRSPVAEVFGIWREVIVAAIDDGADCGRFAPELPAEDIADLLNACVDGCELAIAVDAGIMTPERFRRLVVSLAERLLHPASVERGPTSGEVLHGRAGGR